MRTSGLVPQVQALLFLVAFITSGCDGVTERPETFEVRDSAGIQIVESHAPSLGPEGTWWVSDEPALQIGAMEGQEPFLFSRIRRVLRLDDGRIVVCDGTSQTIRFFDEEGEFISQIGGPGEGPGEFPGLSGCEQTANGIVGFHGRRLANYFSLDGTFLSTIRFPGIGGGAPSAMGFFFDGSILLSAGFADRPPGLSTYSSDLFLLGADGNLTDPRLRFASGRNVAGPDISYSQAYGPTGVFAVSGSSFYYGWSAQYDIAVYDMQSQLRTRVRRAWDPDPVTDEDREWWATSLIHGPMPGGGEPTSGALEARRKIADIQIYPETHPSFDLLKIDPLGCIWVRRSHPRFESMHFNPLQNTQIPRVWDVFDAEGIWLTTVAPPMDLEIHEIGRDFILGLWRDEMDVEYVRVYELHRSGGAGT